MNATTYGFSVCSIDVHQKALVYCASIDLRQKTLGFILYSIDVRKQNMGVIVFSIDLHE